MTTKPFKVKNGISLKNLSSYSNSPLITISSNGTVSNNTNTGTTGLTSFLKGDGSVDTTPLLPQQIQIVNYTVGSGTSNVPSVFTPSQHAYKKIIIQGAGTSAQAIIIPADSAGWGWQVGDWFEVVWGATGTYMYLNIFGGTPPNLNPGEYFDNGYAVEKQWGSLLCIKTAADTWQYHGDLVSI